MSIREILEGRQRQGTNDSITYTVDVTPLGSSPTSPAVAAYDARGRDVTAQLFPSGSASVSGNVITLPACTGVYAGEDYRVVVTFTLGGRDLSVYIPIRGEV